MTDHVDELHSKEYCNNMDSNDQCMLPFNPVTIITIITLNK